MLRIAFVALALSGLAIGCGTTAPPPTDGGVDGWARSDADPGPDSCDPASVHVLNGVAGGSVGIDFDTTMSHTRPRDLGLQCGNPAADVRWAPQEVVEFHVPGTGMQAVSFSTSNSMTAVDFNTVIQVRTGDCRTIPTESFRCFDDVSQTNLASTGAITVAGGSTLYFFITGYSDPPAQQMAVDHGMVHVDFRVAPNTPPVVTGGAVVLVGDNVNVTVNVTDAESGPIAYAIAMYTARGGVDVSGDGAFNAAEDVLLFGFGSVDATAPTYVGHSLLTPATTGYTLAAFCRGNCTEWGVSVLDAGYLLSAETRIPVSENIVHIGQACDATHVCAPTVNCTGGVCVASAAATTECASAMPLDLGMPTTASTMVFGTGTVGGGTGVFTASCQSSPGREQVWHITVPTGDFDLALTTDAPGTPAATDTVMYIRPVCEDPSTELAMGCSDDISMSNLHSALTFRDIPSGDYYVIVDAYGSGAAAMYTIQATLTPVLASGAACDPAMSNYRCATGTCGATSHVCP